jgi:hypothetical protein
MRCGVRARARNGPRQGTDSAFVDGILDRKAPRASATSNFNQALNSTAVRESAPPLSGKSGGLGSLGAERFTPVFVMIKPCFSI